MSSNLPLQAGHFLLGYRCSGTSLSFFAAVFASLLRLTPSLVRMWLTWVLTVGNLISIICPLPGPVLTENLGYYLNLYDIWSSYRVESDGIVVAYTSVYGHTKAAAELLAQKLTDKGCPKVIVHDLARCDMAKAVEDAFRYGKLVLATTTYNADIFPFMKEFIHHLTERNFQNRTIGLMENGSWAPSCARQMRALLEEMKSMEILEPVVTLKSALKDDSLAQLDALRDALIASLMTE